MKKSMATEGYTETAAGLEYLIAECTPLELTQEKLRQTQKKGLFSAIDESKRFKEGERVRISGEVKYGNVFYRVASDGVIVADTKKKSRSTLVLVDSIDGDGGVTCSIENKYISRLV